MDKRHGKIYWHAGVSSGGILDLRLDMEGEFSKEEKESELAEALRTLYESMEAKGYIPFNAQFMSSRDIAAEHGRSRQYWEKLLNEGKILYKETHAGRITTNLWVNGYLDNKEKVDAYVRNVRAVLKTIDGSSMRCGRVICPACDKEHFEFAINAGGNVNGVCRECGLYIHTTH